MQKKEQLRKMKEDLLAYIKKNRSNVNLNSKENAFLESIFGKDKIQINGHELLVKYKQKYLNARKKCDILLESGNIRIWIEGKKKVKLLPINCCHIIEKIILHNDSSFLDIARLIALVDNQNDIRFTLSTVKKEILEYYKRNLLCAEIITDNESEIQIKSKFVCIDIVPVESNRKKIVELSFKASLDNYFLKLNENDSKTYIIVSFVECGIVSLKVYRDRDNPFFEGKEYCYGVEQENNKNFLEEYFPSS